MKDLLGQVNVALPTGAPNGFSPEQSLRGHKVRLEKVRKERDPRNAEFHSTLGATLNANV